MFFYFYFYFSAVTLLLASTVYFTFVFLYFIYYAVNLERGSGWESEDVPECLVDIGPFA